MSSAKKLKKSLGAELSEAGVEYARRLAEHRYNPSPLSGHFVLKEANPLHPMYKDEEQRMRRRARGAVGIRDLLFEKSVANKKMLGLAEGITSGFMRLPQSELMKMNRQYRDTQMRLASIQDKLKTKVFPEGE